jgi:hypothetical protein
MSDAPSVERELRDLNVEIGSKETAGDRAFFRPLLHEAFVFLRASGDVDDKKWFLEKLRKSEERDTRVESIQISHVVLARTGRQEKRLRTRCVREAFSHWAPEVLGAR